MYKFNNLTGKSFGRLTAIKDSGMRAKSRHIIWLCECSCGSVVLVDSCKLVTGNTKSCGCLNAEKIRERGKCLPHLCGKDHPWYKHGDTNSRLYRIWMTMKNRCHNSKNYSYQYYGKKGIQVCDGWKDDFLKFKEWAINNGYSPELTIDRKNSKSGYSPDNCQWISASENSGKAARERWAKKKNHGIQN